MFIPVVAWITILTTMREIIYTRMTGKDIAMVTLLSGGSFLLESFCTALLGKQSKDLPVHDDAQLFGYVFVLSVPEKVKDMILLHETASYT